MTFWPLTSYSDFPTDQTSHQFHNLDTKLDLHRIMSGFHWAFATDMACQQGTLTLPDTWFRPPFLRPECHVFTRLCTLNTPWYFLDFAFQLLPLMRFFFNTNMATCIVEVDHSTVCDLCAVTATCISCGNVVLFLMSACICQSAADDRIPPASTLPIVVAPFRPKLMIVTPFLTSRFLLARSTAFVTPRVSSVC